MNNQDQKQPLHRKPYKKPELVYSKMVEALAIVCDSSRSPGFTCRTVGNASCVKTRD